MLSTKPFLNLLRNTKYINNTIFSLTFSSNIKVKNMSGDCGLPLKKIIEKLETFATPTSAESWDNVGLLIDPMSDKNIQKILLTNDLTEDVVLEGKEKQVDMIISYHPPVFKPLKTVNSSTWKERLVITCIKYNMAVYSPHTSWDVANCGVNDWLAKAFDFMSSTPITETGCGRLLELSAPITLSETMHQVKRHIGIPHVLLGLGRGKNIESMISTVALCAGSGASVLTGVKADVYLTGEMSHHEVLDACQKDISVILCNHSNTERGFLSEFAPELQNTLLERKVEVLVSKVDKDPLVVV